jgi:hypothetical protein
MTGADNARQFEERLARSSRAVAFWSAVGALLILSALVYSGFHLRRVQKKTQEAEASLKAKQAELKEVDARLTKAKQTADIYGLTLNTVSIKSPEETAAAFKRAVSQVPGAAGITIQIASKSQLAKAKEIAGRLRDLGYEVPPDEAIEIRGVHISNENYVRYFFKSDEDLARQIANQIKAMGIDVQPFSLVGEPDLGEVHPRTFEFRLGRKYNP